MSNEISNAEKPRKASLLCDYMLEITKYDNGNFSTLHTENFARGEEFIVLAINFSKSRDESVAVVESESGRIFTLGTQYFKFQQEEK